MAYKSPSNSMVASYMPIPTVARPIAAAELSTAGDVYPVKPRITLVRGLVDPKSGGRKAPAGANDFGSTPAANAVAAGPTLIPYWETKFAYRSKYDSQNNPSGSTLLVGFPLAYAYRFGVNENGIFVGGVASPVASATLIREVFCVELINPFSPIGSLSAYRPIAGSKSLK